MHGGLTQKDKDKVEDGRVDGGGRVCLLGGGGGWGGCLHLPPSQGAIQTHRRASSDKMSQDIPEWTAPHLEGVDRGDCVRNVVAAHQKLPWNAGIFWD